MSPKTTRIVQTADGPAVLLPEGFRFKESTVVIQRDGDAVILEPMPSATWPEGFWDKIRIDDPKFERPDQGEMPPVPKFD